MNDIGVKTALIMNNLRASNAISIRHKGLLPLIEIWYYNGSVWWTFAEKIEIDTDKMIIILEDLPDDVEVIYHKREGGRG